MRRHVHGSTARFWLIPSRVLFAAPKDGLPLVGIKGGVIFSGHKYLDLVWVAKVPVPDDIGESEDIGLYPISRHCLPLCVVSLGGPTFSTTTTTLLAATLPLANTRYLAGPLETWIVANVIQEVGGCLGEIDLYGDIVADDCEEHLKFPPLDPT